MKQQELPTKKKFDLKPPKLKQMKTILENKMLFFFVVLFFDLKWINIFAV